MTLSVRGFEAFLWSLAVLSTSAAGAGGLGDVKGGRAEMGDGVSLAYDVAGKGRTVVLIHGGLLDRTMWDREFVALSRRFRVVRYDVRGNGDSGTPKGPWADHEDLARLLDHLGCKRAALVGLSLGGRIAIDFALAHPERTSGVAAVSPGLSGFDFPATSADPHAAALRAAWAKGDVEGAAEAFQSMWTDGPRREPSQVNPKVRSTVREMVRRGLARQMAGGGPPPQPDELKPPAVGRLREIRTPMLVLVGDLDMADILTIGGRLASEVPGARQVVVAGAAHMVNLEKPAEFERHVEDFLSTLPGE